jgi:anti-sigma factor RsiW
MSTPRADDELLSAYLDGEVTADERGAVDAALARSAERRAALAGLGEAREAVRALGQPELPAGFLDGVERAVAADRPPSVVAGAAAHGSRSRRGLAWLAGGVAAAALVAAFVIPPTDHVDPAVSARVDTHAARASVSDDPVSELAPVAAASGGLRR